MNIPFLSATIYVWHFYPKMIKWKIENRNLLNDNEHELRHTINVSIIVDLATFLEGMVSQILLTVLDRKSMSIDDFYKRIINKIKLDMAEITWSNYNKYIELISGTKLSDKLDPEIIKAVNFLFKFRNKLVHANNIKINYFECNGKIDYSSSLNYETIIKYLKEKKLIDLNINDFPNITNVINDNVINHFNEFAMNYIRELLKIFPENEIKDIRDIYSSILKQ